MRDLHLAVAFSEEFDLQLGQLKRLTTHGPSLGRFVELSLINLLSKYFPQSVAFRSGFIYGMDLNGEKRASSQLDVICFDRVNFPIVFDVNEIVVVVPAAVKGIVEVKSRLRTDSLRQILSLAESEVMREVPIDSRVHLLGVESDIKPETAFNYLRDYYENDATPKYNKFLGAIACLAWDEMLICHTKIEEDKIKYTCARVEAMIGNPIGWFASQLLHDLFGVNASVSIANVLAPSLYRVIEDFSLDLTARPPGYSKGEQE